MSTTIPPEWEHDKTVPTSTIKIMGQGGDVVGTVTVVGSATVTTSWPYRYVTTVT